MGEGPPRRVDENGDRRSRGPSSRLATAVILLAVVGCTEDTSSSAVSTAVADIAPVLRGRIDLRIGDSAGEDAELFGDVRGLELGADGRIWVADRQARNVRAFSPVGDPLLTLGGPGEGPGEFPDGPWSVALDPEGRLWVQSGSWRFDVFSLGGEPRWMRTLTVPGRSFRGDPVMFDGAGHPILRAYPPRGSRRHGTHVRVATDGAVVEEVPLPESASPDRLGWGVLTHPGHSTPTRMPGRYSPLDLVASAPDGGFAHAVTDRYAIDLFDASGRRTGRIEREVEGPVLSSAERPAARVAADSLGRRAEAAGGDYRPPEERDRKPPIRNLWYDREGRLWVELWTAEQETTRRADVYDGTARLAFVAEWPEGVLLAGGAVRGRTALGVEKTALDVQRVVRVRFR